MRGKLPYATKTDLKDGITPAGAGKTKSFQAWLATNEDHPRRCGENVAPMSSISAAPGSPPQVRGKLFLNFCRNLDSGITPAGAGKTSKDKGRNE